MPAKLVLQVEDLHDLSIIRDLGAETIQVIINKLSSLDPPPLRPSDLHQTLNEILPNRSNEVNSVMRQLMCLYTIRRMHDLSAKDLLEGLLHSIATSEPCWTEDEISRWRALEPQLNNLFSLPNVSTIVKALDLAYDYTDLLQDVKILTDIRPVFNEDASGILGALVSFTLRLSLDGREGRKSLSITVDEKDVEKLKQICDRALKKAETAKDFMCKHNIKRTFICGEE